MPLLELNELENLSPLFRVSLGNGFGRMLMRILSVDKINELYDRNSSLVGPAFAKAVLDEIGVKYEVLNSSVLDDLPDGPFITVSNHPYGHIDGMMLVDLFGSRRPDFKVMVNKFLGRINTLENNFISVTPTGSVRTAPTMDSIRGIKDAVSHVREGHPLGIFPSGAVSDLSLKEGCVRDREWQEPVIRHIMKMNVPVVPVYFADRNAVLYYSLGLLDWRIRLLRLPAEVFNKRDKKVRVILGNIISPEEQRGFEDTDDFRPYLRSKVYGHK